jgi:hypothetical protein
MMRKYLFKRCIMKRPASLVAGIFFIFLAVAQLCRFILAVRITAGGMEIPVWPSAVAFLILTGLAIWLLKERSRP